MRDLLQVHNLNYQLLGILNDNSNDIARNITLEKKINAIDTLTFELSLTSSKWQYIINENIVEWQNEYYLIKNPNFSHSKDKKIVTVECEHLSVTLESKIKQELELIGVTANDMIDEILQGTGWSIGNITVENKYRTLQSKDISAFSALVSVAEKYDAMLIFNSVARTVDLTNSFNDRGLQIRKYKNLKSINLNYDTKGIVTRLHVRGGQDPDTGNEISIVGVNPTGKSYIDNFSFYLDQGYTQEYIDAHPELFLHEQTWNASEYIEEQVLYDDAVKKLETLCKPQMTCSLDASDLSMFPEEFVHTPDLGEYVYVYDEDFNLSLKARVESIKKNFDNPLDMSITITNILQYNSVLNQLVDSSKAVSKIVTPLQEILGQYIKQATIDDAHIKRLSAEKIDAGDVATDRLIANVVNAINAYIGEAKIDLAKIKQITAGSAVIAKGAIGSAQISDLDVDKLNAGILDTVKFTVAGRDGRLTIKDNRLQVFDEDENSLLFERVVIGDVNGDGTVYGFRVRGADGTTLLITEQGITKEGFTDGYNKLDDGSLDGKKLDIETVVTAINNGTTNITGSRVYMDDKTLDITIKDIKQTQTDMQNQLDGVQYNWFYAYVPTLSNAPAIDWNTTALLDDHVGDTFTDTTTDVNGNSIGYSYRFIKDTDGTYKWAKIVDTDTSQALQMASKAQDTADSKRRVFTAQPTTPYDVGDLWTQGSTGDLMRCKVAKASGGSFDSLDWEKAVKYTDDTVALSMTPHHIILSNENQSILTDSTGATKSAITITTSIDTYKGSNRIAGTIGTLVLKDVNGNTITGATLTSTNPTSSAGGSVTMTIASGTNLSSDIGYVEIPITIETNSYTKKLSWNKAKDGTNGTNGTNAKVATIQTSSQMFKSTDGGTTFSPNTITLTPLLQNVTFSKWQYSIDGGSAFIDASGANGITIASNILTLSKDSTLFTNTVTTIIFKLVTSDATVYDTLTIVKLYDVTNIKIGGKNLILDSDEKITSTDYLIRQYTLSENFVANDDYTFVIKGTVATNQKFAVFMNNGANNIGYVTTTFVTGINYITFKAITTTAGNENKIGLYNYPSGTTSSTVEWVALYKGNKPMDWTQAPEDTTTAIDSITETINNQNTQITGLSTEISLKASQTELNKVNGILTEYDTKFSELTTKADGVTISVNDIKTRVDNNETDLQNINTYFDFTTDGMTIGKNDSPLQITISNSEMDFVNGGTVVAYVNGQKMYISSAEILNSLIVGVHKIEKYNSNITLVRYVG